MIKLIPVAIFINLGDFKVKATDFIFPIKITYRSYMFYSLSLVRLAIFKVPGKIYEKCRKKSSRLDGYGPHTQVKCQL